MIRLLALLGALAGAGVLSQYPAFAQQYLQRLAGQVDALAQVARDFDASALAAGLGREEALAQLQGTDFLDARQTDMRATFARHARLSDDLTRLRAASPLELTLMPQRLADPATFRATWDDFEPAVPLSMAGAVTGGAGFLGGWAAVLALLSLIRRPLRRAATPRDAGPRPRVEPALHRTIATPDGRPQLVAERRELP